MAGGKLSSRYVPRFQPLRAPEHFVAVLEVLLARHKVLAAHGGLWAPAAGMMNPWPWPAPYQSTLARAKIKPPTLAVVGPVVPNLVGEVAAEEAPDLL